MSTRDEQARERCEAELTALRAREKAASAGELSGIIDRKAELKQMRKLGIYYEQQRPALGGFSLPWSKPQVGEGGAGQGGSSGFKLPQLPQMPKLPTADDLPFQLPTGLDVELAAGTASFGTVTGFCSGVALKKIGRAAAAVTGVLFMGLTAAERSGFIEVKWDKVQQFRRFPFPACPFPSCPFWAFWPERCDPHPSTRHPHPLLFAARVGEGCDHRPAGYQCGRRVDPRGRPNLFQEAGRLHDRPKLGAHRNLVRHWARARAARRLSVRVRQNLSVGRGEYFRLPWGDLVGDRRRSRHADRRSQCSPRQDPAVGWRGSAVVCRL